MAGIIFKDSSKTRSQLPGAYFAPTLAGKRYIYELVPIDLYLRIKAL
jgi:hypothetical protein